MCMRDLFELTQCEQSLTAHGFLRILFSMKTQKRRKYKYWNISNSKFIAIKSSNVFCDNFSASHVTNSLAASLNCKMSWKARRHTSDDRSINSCCVAIFQLQYARMHFTPHSSSRTSKNEHRRTQEPTNNCFVCISFCFIVSVCESNFQQSEYAVESFVHATPRMRLANFNWIQPHLITDPRRTKCDKNGATTTMGKSGKSLLQIDGCLLSGESSVPIHFMCILHCPTGRWVQTHNERPESEK